MYVLILDKLYIHIWCETHELQRHSPTHHYGSCHVHRRRPKVIVSFKAKGDGSFELSTPGENELRMAAEVFFFLTLLETTDKRNNWKAGISTSKQCNPPFSALFLGYLN